MITETFTDHQFLDAISRTNVTVTVRDPILVGGRRISHMVVYLTRNSGGQLTPIRIVTSDGSDRIYLSVEAWCYYRRIRVPPTYIVASVVVDPASYGHSLIGAVSSSLMSRGDVDWGAVAAMVRDLVTESSHITQEDQS